MSRRVPRGIRAVVSLETRSASLPIMLGWQVLALGLVLSLPMLASGTQPWRLARPELLRLGMLLGAFGVTALTVIAVRRSPLLLRLGLSMLVSLAAFGMVCLLLVLAGKTVSRPLLLGSLAICTLLLPLPLISSAIRLPGLAALVLALLGAGVLGDRQVRAAAAERLQPRVSFTNSAFYNLQLTSYEHLIPRPAARGGGLDTLGDQYLLGTGDGALYALTIDDAGIQARQLAQRVPLNAEEFAKFVGVEYREPRLYSMWHGPNAPRIQPWRFRVADVLVQPLGPGARDPLRLYASHHYWKSDEQCFVLRVSVLETTREALLTQTHTLPWKTVFETQPCLPLSGPDAKAGPTPFRGEEIGGRMALVDARTLLLTVGDLGYAGLESTQRYAQDPAVSYGKTLLIDLDSGASELNTLGHRNSQGLYIAGNGDVWQTEHGEQGGDELNLLVQGTNYGWPLVTYGTSYGGYTWPLSSDQGRHTGYTAPVYAWVPSIGTSNLIMVRGTAFPVWRGDLLVGSLATRSLYRLHLEDHRVVFSEPIAIGKRIRDLLELKEGRVLLWTDDSALLTVASVDVATSTDGALLFGSLCGGCHTRADGTHHRIGPDLGGIVGRAVAAAPGFATYTQALQRLGGAWTRERLDRFLADPQAMAPGTSMELAGMPHAEQRAVLIDYIAGE